ncbi:hypothetical protein J2S11_002518 [Bacillus horti]|uniref:DUF2634 domain-containing protein n=2 Tax=Caldalkalibacillus horti TaxID=77523 RepID=A0ABT9W038_9BACI|nr:hypothetical protein [Bacillus horti]
MNTNEVFPILDMINRERNKKNGIHLSGIGGYADQNNDYITDAWQIESLEIIRDAENEVDPHVISQVAIAYRNGASEMITLKRGLTPPIDSNLPDSDYINHILIREVVIETSYQLGTSVIQAKILRENDFGSIQRVELEYDDEHIQHSHTE